MGRAHGVHADWRTGLVQGDRLGQRADRADGLCGGVEHSSIMRSSLKARNANGQNDQ
jgi:hypothetical protein